MLISEIREKYWTPLASSHREATWGILERSYSDRIRAYHSWRHVNELLEKLNSHASLSMRPDLIATAIFWHDVVYLTCDPDQGRRSDYQNVFESSQVFRCNSLLRADEADAVNEMIMATADHLEYIASGERYPGFCDDLDLFLDLDLSPLAAPWRQFAQNFEDIRFEHRCSNETDFHMAQITFFEKLLSKKCMFRRVETRREWQNLAKENCARCLRKLRD